jgi:protein-tyrosine phosphatase
MARIELHGARNVRDLGNLPTVDGRKTASGRLFRGDTLSRLDDADVAVLAELGLDTVIDFRGAAEVDHAGPDRVPAGARVVSLPVAGGDVSAVLGSTGGSRDPAQQRELLGDGRAAELMRQVNRQFVTVPEFRAAFGRAVRLVAQAGGRPVLYHCTAGKDRTGWMTAIVLTVLGVPRETVVTDYLATNDYVWAAYGAWLERLAEAGELADPELFRPLLHQDPSYLAAAFDEVDAHYGTFDRFLVDGLELTDADIAALRDSLLD